MENNKLSREELLAKLHNKVNMKQTSRLNKVSKNKKIEDMKKKITGNNAEMGEMFNKVLDKTKKKNRKNNKRGKPTTLDDIKKNIDIESLM